MKSLLKVAVAGIVCVGLWSAAAQAQVAYQPVPAKVNVQGVLRNVLGEPVTGSYTVKFTLYDAASGGNILSDPPAQSMTLVGGVFNTWVPAPTTAFVDRSAVYLGIRINSDPELPRTEVTSVGFAYQAGHAEYADFLLGAATDVECTGCVGPGDVSFNWAAGVSAGGAAANLQCDGCVSGGAGGDLAADTVTSANIANLTILAEDLAPSSVTNAKLAPDAVTTDKIAPGAVGTSDLAANAVTTDQILDGTILPVDVSFNFAGSNSKGGAATALECPGECVGSSEVSFNWAAATTKGGDAAGLDCVASPCVSDSEITFNYAASATKGGAATNLNCTNCVESGEVSFNYAGSTSKGGAATALSCVNCVDSGAVNFNYAGSTSRGGEATGLACTGCVTAAKTNFAWAAGNNPSGGGAATDLVCSSAAGCVETADIGALQVTDAKIATGITGSKVNAATSGVRGAVRIGSGLTVAADGLLTPTWGTGALQVAEGNHTHSEYWQNGLADVNVGNGYKINFLDPGDNPGDHYAYLSQSTGSTSNTTAVRLTLGTSRASNEWFEIWGQSGIGGAQMHTMDAGGLAMHRGGLELKGLIGTTAGTAMPVADILKCPASGCVDSDDIVDGTIQGVDIAANTIQGGNISPTTSITTSGTIQAGTMRAAQFIDTNNANYLADPNGTSRFNTINYDTAVTWTGTAAGLTGATIRGSSVGNYLNNTTFGLNNQSGYCGGVEVFGSACTNNTMTVWGTVTSNVFRDRDDPSNFYLDMNGTSRVAQLNFSNGSYLNSAGTNVIRGATTAFDGAWTDYNDANRQVDPSGTTKLGELEAHLGVKVLGWPTGPAGNTTSFTGFGGIGLSAGDLFLGPNSASGSRVYFRYGTANRFMVSLNGASNAAIPSIRTNGAYLVINSSSTLSSVGDTYTTASKKHLLLQWDQTDDTNTHTRIKGNLYATNLVDRQNETCYLDPSNRSVMYEGQFTKMAAAEGTVTNLRANSIGVNGGIVQPFVNATGQLGSINVRWNWIYVQNAVNVSQRSEKRDIYYLNEQDLAGVGDILYGFKPTTYFYKNEHAPTGTDQDDPAYTRAVPHWGLILDEMPDFMVAGGGWGLNDSVGFLLVASKYLEDKSRAQAQQIQDLEHRIAALEQIMVDAGLIK